jgi:putative hydrolase of the HAD superfamily
MLPPIRAVGFDLGNTLVRYYGRAEWPAIRDEGLRDVAAYLDANGLLRVRPAEVSEAADRERSLEPPDSRVRPLEERIRAIFRLGESVDELLVREACGRFLRGTFAVAHRYEDTLPVLDALRARGLRLAILSNTPWGSPAEPWREEVARHGLTERVDTVLFCRDVGWRKPATAPFALMLERLGVGADECLFVGDEPRWDLGGAEAAGLPAVLIDRTGATPGAAADLWEAARAALT